MIAEKPECRSLDSVAAATSLGMTNFIGPLDTRKRLLVGGQA